MSLPRQLLKDIKKFSKIYQLTNGETSLIITLSIVTVTIIAAMGLWVLGRDEKPTHPQLTKNKLPRRLSIKSLFANSDAVWGFEPSFDAKQLAWWGTKWGRATVFVGALAKNGKLKRTCSLRGSIQNFTWLPYEMKLNVLSEGRLWQVDPINPSRKNWVDVTPRGFQTWNLLSEAETPHERHVIASFDRNPALIDLYTIRPDGGGKEVLVENEGETQSWIVNGKHLPVVKINKIGEQRAYFFKEGAEAAWKEFARVLPQEVLNVWLTSRTGCDMEALSNRGRDKVALVSIDPQTGQETVLLEDSQVDIVEVFQFSRYSRSDLAIIRNGYPTYVGLSDRGKIFVDLLNVNDGPLSLELIGFSNDGLFITTAISRSERPFDFFLFDLQQKTVTKIAKRVLTGDYEAFSETRAVTIKARDGLLIPAFLTSPRNASAEQRPSIIMIHGGPAEHDVWGYNREKHFLSNRGYTLLSVNYRGSTGYGKIFQAAGYGEFGKAMQDDIVDAAQWLIYAKIADPENIAVMGASYGGYCAALAMTRDPGIFRAAIVEYGMLDIEYQMKNNPFAWSLYRDQVAKYFGDPDNPVDLNKMSERSPIHYVSNVTQPILITAGKQDRVIGFEQSEEFEKLLKKAGKSVYSIYFEKEGHGYTRWQTKVTRARAIEKFLGETLGGRIQKFEIAELAARYWK